MPASAATKVTSPRLGARGKEEGSPPASQYVFCGRVGACGDVCARGGWLGTCEPGFRAVEPSSKRVAAAVAGDLDLVDMPRVGRMLVHHRATLARRMRHPADHDVRTGVAAQQTPRLCRIDSPGERPRRQRDEYARAYASAEASHCWNVRPDTRSGQRWVVRGRSGSFRVGRSGAILWCHRQPLRDRPHRGRDVTGESDGPCRTCKMSVMPDRNTAPGS